MSGHDADVHIRKGFAGQVVGYGGIFGDGAVDAQLQFDISVPEPRLFGDAAYGLHVPPELFEEIIQVGLTRSDDAGNDGILQAFCPESPFQHIPDGAVGAGFTPSAQFFGDDAEFVDHRVLFDRGAGIIEDI